VPETLIDASIESIRIFFELDAQFPNEYEQNQLKNICLSVADGMFRQTDSYFAKLIKELNERQPCKDDLTHLYQHTCLCLERGQRFIRRINGGINPRVPSEDTEYQSSLKTLESRLSGIWGELVHTFDTCLVPQSLYDLMGMYNELLNPNSRRGKYYREDPRLELALRSFKIEF